MDLITRLLNETESNYLDFKKEWHGNKVSLLYDILCFSNSLSNEEYRYIVIGVKEDSKTKVKEYYDVEGNDNRKTEEDIITFLREYMYVIPEVKVNTYTIDEKNIDIISIKPLFRNLPYALKKEISYQGQKDKKVKKILKNIICSRDGAVNTSINESASIPTVEELFNRKAGNHLSPQEKFNEYIKDLDGWGSPDRSNQSFYYSKNSAFKILVHEVEDGNSRDLNKLEGYNELLRDTYLSEDIWKYKRNPMHCSIEEGFEWFKVDIFENDTNIYSSIIMNVLLKHYPTTGNIKMLYIPTDLTNSFKFELNRSNLKESIKGLPDYKLCRLLHKFNNKSGNVDEVLDFLNYEYLENIPKYIKEKEDLFYQGRG